MNTVTITVDRTCLSTPVFFSMCSSRLRMRSISFAVSINDELAYETEDGGSELPDGSDDGAWVEIGATVDVLVVVDQDGQRHLNSAVSATVETYLLMDNELLRRSVDEALGLERGDEDEADEDGPWGHCLWAPVVHRDLLSCQW